MSIFLRKKEYQHYLPPDIFKHDLIFNTFIIKKCIYIDANVNYLIFENSGCDCIYIYIFFYSGKRLAKTDFEISGITFPVPQSR